MRKKSNFLRKIIIFFAIFIFYSIIIKITSNCWKLILDVKKVRFGGLKTRAKFDAKII